MPKIFRTLAGPRLSLLVLPLAALLARPTLAQLLTPATFAPLATYSTGGNGSFDLVTGDVNGDGKLDLATANAGSNTVGVLLGTGTGIFGPATTFSTGSDTPNGISIADVNGDGKPDLLTANPFSNSVGVLLGTGTGTFGPATTFGTGASSLPTYVAVADINGDSKPDLLTANAGNGTVGVLLGTGTGSFGPATTYSTGAASSPVGLAVADVNGDGHPDLLTANTGSNSMVGVLLGTATGTFGAVTTYSTGPNSSARSIDAVDVNGDGKLDLVAVNSSNGTVVVLQGTGTGTFGALTSYLVGTGSAPSDAAVADVNGDGNLDFVTANYGNDTAGVLLITSSRTSGGVTTYSTGTGSTPTRVAVADVNGDGRLDLLSLNYGSASVGVLLNTSGNTSLFQPVTLYFGSGGTPYSIAAPDLNKDGLSDIVTANYNDNSVGATLSAGVSLGPAIRYSAGTGTNPTSVAVADVNGDGNLDLVTANYASSTAGVLLGTGSFGTATTFGAPATFGTGAGSRPQSIAVADVNGDGKPDLLTANTGTDAVGVLLGTGTGTFGAVTIYSTGAGSAPRSIAVADVNGDGLPDLLTANNGNSTAGVLLGTGAGSFGAVTTYSTGAGNAPQDVAVADVNGDGKLDLLTANTSSNTVGVLLGAGTGTFGAVTTYSTGGGSAPIGLAVADVNGDGLPDLLTANFSTNTAGVLLGTGAGAFGGVTTYSTGTGSMPRDIAAGDVNGDGLPDLLTANANGTVGVLLGVATSTPTPTALSPTSGPVGTSVTITGANLLGATAVSFGGTAATTFTVVNATTLTATVPAGATTGAVTVTTPNGTGSSGTFTVITDLVVTTTRSIQPGTYNSITLNSPGVGTLAGPVAVTSAVLVNSGATLNDGCYVLSGPASFLLAAGGTLSVCAAAGISSSGATGAIQTTGTRSFAADASYVYNGPAAQTTGTGLPAQVRSLATTNATTLSLSAALSVAQVLTVGGAGDLVTGGQSLTLLSTAAGTALLVNSGTGRVVGTATVQRYINPTKNGGLGYRHYSAPVSNTTVADLTTTGFMPEVNPAYNTAADPALVKPFPTVFGYDQALVNRTNSSPAFDKGFFSPATLGDPLVSGRGYVVQIGATPLVDFVGTLNQGTLTVGASRNAAGTLNDGAAGWQLLGNPYASPLDLSRLASTDYPGFEAATYVYESNAPYTGSYRSFVNGIGSNPLLASCQGFFMRVGTPGTSTTFTFRDAQRVTAYASQAPFYRTSADLRPQVQLELRTASGEADTFFAYAEASASNGFDSQHDAWKLANATGLNLGSTTTNGESLSIDGRPAFTATTTIALAIGVPTAGTYALAAADLANLPAGLDAYLRDAQTGQLIKLSAGTSYSFSVSAAEAQHLITGRFSLLFRPATALATAPSLSPAEVAVYPNPARESFTVAMPAVADATAVQATLLNTLGQVMRQQTAALPAAGARLTLATTGLAPGVYTLCLQAGTATIAKRVVVQ